VTITVLAILLSTLYEDDEPRESYMDNYLQLLSEWGYPRISQFIFTVLAALKVETPNCDVWKRHMEIPDIIPADVRDEEIRKAVRKLHRDYRTINVTNLKKILPIDGTVQEFYNYIRS